jgi:hypothetical protein
MNKAVMPTAKPIPTHPSSETAKMKKIASGETPMNQGNGPPGSSGSMWGKSNFERIKARNCVARSLRCPVAMTMDQKLTCKPAPRAKARRLVGVRATT